GQAARRSPGSAYVLVCAAVKAFRVVPKRGDASVTTKLAGHKRRSSDLNRAVAAATGRRFKSSRPDLLLVTGDQKNVLLLRTKKSKTKSSYLGSCRDLHYRIRRHNAGGSKATRHGLAWILLRSERFSSRTEATRRERYYKTGRGRDELNRLK